MATREPRIVKDGCVSTLGGGDSGRSPSLINPNQVAFALNVVMRGGFPKTRPGFTKRPLIFENDEQQSWYESHVLQGGKTYEASRSKHFKLAMVGGRLFKIEPLNKFKVSELTPTASTSTTANFTVPAIGSTVDVTVADASMIFVGYPLRINNGRYMVTAKAWPVVTVQNLDDTAGNVIVSPASVLYLDVNDPLIPRAFFEQARQWMVIQNGLDGAILFDGGSARRSRTSGTEKVEVPVGTVMAYVQNRLWVATPGDQVAAGDIANGPTDVINFTEEILGLIGPARFQIDGEITALVENATIDTSLGQGPVQVFTRNAAHSINVPFNRTLWAGLTYPIQTVSLNHGGSVSQYSTIQVNSDLHYRAPDGWRSFVISRREDSEWGNVPISSELDRILNDDDGTLLEFSSALLFGNRVIFTVNPRNSANGVYHRGLAVFDLDPISMLGNKSSPAYDMLWDGVNVALLSKGDFNKVERAFMFVLNALGKNELWEIDPMAHDDNGNAIKCAVEYRSFNFRPGSNEFTLTKLASLEIWPRQIRGTVEFRAKWRPDAADHPDEAPCFYDWATRTVCSTTQDCDQNTADCKTLKNYKAGYRNRLAFGQPPDDVCEPQSNAPPRLGFEHQIRLEWDGSAAVKKLICKAEIVEEDVFPPCDEP